MTDSPQDGFDTENISESLSRALDRVLADTRTTADLWNTLQRLGPTSAAESPFAAMLRNALKTELSRREEQDVAKIYRLVEEALVTGDLRPYWAARDAYASTSPDVTGRLFPHETDDTDDALPRDPAFPDEAYSAARRRVRDQIAVIEETTPTGSVIEAFAVLEDAIEREDPARREPLRHALSIERRRQSRSARNLLRTRLALALAPGRSFEHFHANRVYFADLAPHDREALFRRS